MCLLVFGNYMSRSNILLFIRLYAYWRNIPKSMIRILKDLHLFYRPCMKKFRNGLWIILSTKGERGLLPLWNPARLKMGAWNGGEGGNRLPLLRAGVVGCNRLPLLRAGVRGQSPHLKVDRVLKAYEPLSPKNWNAFLIYSGRYFTNKRTYNRAFKAIELRRWFLLKKWWWL